MITTGMLKDLKFDTDRKITIYDDINNTNLENAIDAFDKCNLFIDKKFDMPSASQSLLMMQRSDTISKINNKLSMLDNEVKQGKSKVVSNETQYRNLRAKICCWCDKLFDGVIKELDNKNTPLVFIDTDKISKHEWLFITWLYDIGVSFFIVCNNARELIVSDSVVDCNIVKEIYETSEKLDYRKNKEISVNVKNTQKKKYNNLDEVETAIYENKTPLQLIINGIDNYVDTCNFYGRIYKESKSNPKFKLCLYGFDKITYEQSMAIPRIKNDKADYIIETVIKFLNIKNTEVQDSLKNSIRGRFNQKDLYNLESQKLFNKIVHVVLTLNNLFNNNLYDYVVYYGIVSNNNKIVLEVLSKVTTISFLVLTPDKQSAINIDGVETLELPNTTETFDMPTVDTRANANTLAAQVSRKVDEQLFSGNILGMYKSGQFRTMDVKLFTTTFDEIELWWNKETHIRPGFESLGDKAVIPTMFKVIKGVKDNAKEYNRYIQSLSCGKTIICKNVQEINELSAYRGQSYTHDFDGVYIHRMTDINKTKFETQKPFYENGKLNRKRIQTDVNYKYGFLDGTKQELIIDRIEKIINSEFINISMYDNKEVFIDNVLNLLLNLDIEILRYIQWFEFYTYNPNLIIALTDEKTISMNNAIITLFLYLMGFDILIFVPTCYTSVENILTNKFMYDIHTIGEATYDVDIQNIELTSNTEIKQSVTKKQGFFNKIFNK